MKSNQSDKMLKTMNSELRTKLNENLKEALKTKQPTRLATIRLIAAALKDRDIAARGDGNEAGISDGEILSMLQSMIKQRNESAKTYADAGRPELAGREEEEIDIIAEFLPKQLDENEMAVAIDGAIKKSGAADIKDMGKVMAVLRDEYAGRMDMGRASGLVKQKLAA